MYNALLVINSKSPIYSIHLALKLSLYSFNPLYLSLAFCVVLVDFETYICYNINIVMVGDYMKKTLILLFTFIIMLVNCKVLASSVEDRRRAVAEVAEAYLRKDQGRIQYDSLRRNIYLAPEDFTFQSTGYITCASYTTAVYYQAFGIINPYYAKQFTDAGISSASGSPWPNGEYVDVAFSGECSTSVDESSADGIKNSCSNIFRNSEGSIYEKGGYKVWYEEWYNTLEIGDVIGIVYNDGSAHTMLVTEKDDEYANSSSIRLSEAAGGEGNVYNVRTHTYTPTSNSTIRLINLQNLWQRYSSVFDANNNPKYVKSYAIVRFISEDDNLQLTESAQSRIDYSGIDTDKTSTIDNQYNNRYYVSPGDKVKYTIKITNNSSSDYENLKVTETLDDNVEIIDKSDGNLDGKKISWSVNIPSGDSLDIVYTVKVKDNANVDYVVSRGMVGNIASRTIRMKVGKRLNSEQQELLITTYDRISKNQKNDFEILNELYNKVLSINVFENSNFSLLENIKLGTCHNIENYFGTTSIITDYCDVSVNDTHIKKMLIGNYYSIETIYQKNQPNSVYIYWLHEEAAKRSDNSRATEVMLSDLQIGDVLVVDNDEDNDLSTSLVEAYIYLNNKFIKADGTKKYSDDELTSLLNSLAGKSYVLLRPIQSVVQEEKNEVITQDNIAQVVKVQNTLKRKSIIVILFSLVSIVLGGYLVYNSCKQKR